jgi:hypothetical protein
VEQGCPRHDSGTFYESEVREFLAQKKKRGEDAAKVKLATAKAALADKKVQTQSRKLQMDIKAGKMHDIVKCQQSLGEFAVALWSEWLTFPDRVQNAHPEVPGLKATMQKIVAASGQTIRAFASENAGKSL